MPEILLSPHDERIQDNNGLPIEAEGLGAVGERADTTAHGLGQTALQGEAVAETEPSLQTYANQIAASREAMIASQKGEDRIADQELADRMHDWCTGKDYFKMLAKGRYSATELNGLVGVLQETDQYLESLEVERPVKNEAF